MSWIYENTLSWIQRVCFYVLKCGTVPKHVAIIMDGNRRFAKKNNVKKSEGHKKGFDKLAETLQWCLDMNIYEVTVYAFSIENFKRSKEEVDTLMDLAKEKFRTLIDEWEKLKEHGICIRVIGNLSLVPEDLLTLILVAMLLTKDNSRGYLNIAFSYTAREELTAASKEIGQGLVNKELDAEDVTEKLVDQSLYTYQSTNPELIIRTSGEVRLSDFLTWQCADSYIHFVSVLWPEFSAWNLMYAVFCYQHFSEKLRKSTAFRGRLQRGTSKGNGFADALQKNRQRNLLKTCLDARVLNEITELQSYSCEQIYDYYKKRIAPNSDEEKLNVRSLEML